MLCPMSSDDKALVRSSQQDENLVARVAQIFAFLAGLDGPVTTSAFPGGYFYATYVGLF